MAKKKTDEIESNRFGYSCNFTSQRYVVGFIFRPRYFNAQCDVCFCVVYLP